MSKIKSFLIAALVAASSTAAMADTTLSASGRVTFGTQSQTVPGHRREPAPTVVARRPQQPAPAAWVTLSSRAVTGNGAITLYPNQSLVLSQIRLETINATALIAGVNVRFVDGRSQYFTPTNKTLDGVNPTFDIQLANRQVSRITVDASSVGGPAEFKVMALGQMIEVPSYPPAPAPPPAYEPQLLAQNVSLSRYGRASIAVPPAVVRGLRLQAVGGPLNLDVVTVRFTDGTSIRFDDIARMRNGETVNLDIGRRKEVSRIIVTSQSRRSRGQLTIFGD